MTSLLDVLSMLHGFCSSFIIAVLLMNQLEINKRMNEVKCLRVHEAPI